MKRQFQLSIALLLAFFDPVHGQYYFYNSKYYNSPVLAEVGFSVGGFNCLTDLGGRRGPGKRFIKDLNLRDTHPGAGVYGEILFDQVIGFRVEFSLGKVSASDDILENDHSEARNRYYRNLQFQTNLSELAAMAEWLPLSLLNSESHPLLSPYILAGVGVFKFNPKAYFKDRWVDLHPLRTEGQGFKEYPSRQPYKLTQLNFLIGLGIRYEISAIFIARIEAVYRLLRTDYLDDVSTHYIDPEHFYSNLNVRDAAIALAIADRSSEIRPGRTNFKGEIRGNAANKDAYFSCNLKMGMLLNRKRR
jgi:Domain of unknown function (DUF6089)